MTAFEEFLKGYMVCALWSSTDDSGEPFDKNYEVANFSQETKNEMRAECQNFFTVNLHLMTEAKGDFSQHGHDFWLSRNGHGAGFFDRDNGIIGDKLQSNAQFYDQKYLFVADDGMIYQD